MQVNGYKIQQTLRELQNQREVMAASFNEGLFQFEGDEDMHPEAAFGSFVLCEQKIAKLQVIQAQYNLHVKVKVLNEEMTLHEAVKRIGGAGRGEKMWRTAAKTNGRDKYSYREMERNKDAEHAKRAVPVGDCMNYARDAAKLASALREAVQVGNATQYEISGEEYGSLFE